MDNTLSLGDIAIVIQSCDKTWANIGIFINRDRQSAAYHHVNIPALMRIGYEPHRFDALSNVEYDAILLENREKIIEIVAALNGICRDEPVQVALF